MRLHVRISHLAHCTTHLPRSQGPDPGLDTNDGDSDASQDGHEYDRNSDTSEGLSTDEDEDENTDDELPDYRLSDAEKDDSAFRKKGRRATVVCHPPHPLVLLTSIRFLIHLHAAGT